MSSRRKISWILIVFGVFSAILYGYRTVAGGPGDSFDFIIFAIFPLGYGLFLAIHKPHRLTPALEKTILTLASEQNNLLTAADVALHTTLSMEQSGEALDELRKKGYVNLKVAENGALVYEFQAFLSMEAKLNAERV